MKTPRIYEKKIDETTSDGVPLEAEEEIFTPRQALQNLRRHLVGVVDSIDKVLRHTQKTVK